MLAAKLLILKENKKIQKNLKRCRDGVPKSKKTRVGIA